MSVPSRSKMSTRTSAKGAVSGFELVCIRSPKKYFSEKRASARFENQGNFLVEKSGSFFEDRMGADNMAPFLSTMVFGIGGNPSSWQRFFPFGRIAIASSE